MKRVIYSVVLICLLSLLVGCDAKNQNDLDLNGETNVLNGDSEPDESTSGFDNELKTVKTYEASVVMFDKTLVFKTLDIDMDNTETVSEEYGVYKSGDTYIQIMDGISSMLSIRRNNTDFYQSYSDEYADLVTDDELSFQKKEDVISEASSFLEQIGISEPKCCDCYALPISYHKNINDEALQNKSSETISDEEWKELGDCYEIIFTTSYDGINLTLDGYVSMDDSIYNGGKIVLYYNKEGIARVEAPNPYKINAEGEAVDIISKEKAHKALKNKMDSQIVTSNYTIVKAELCYFPQVTDAKNNKFSLIPIWEITVIDQDDENDKLIIRFDAKTGREIVC